LANTGPGGEQCRSAAPDRPAKTLKPPDLPKSLPWQAASFIGAAAPIV
jgi:hypothetical protein